MSLEIVPVLEGILGFIHAHRNGQYDLKETFRRILELMNKAPSSVRASCPVADMGDKFDERKAKKILASIEFTATKMLPVLKSPVNLSAVVNEFSKTVESVCESLARDDFVDLPDTESSAS